MKKKKSSTLNSKKNLIWCMHGVASLDMLTQTVSGVDRYNVLAFVDDHQENIELLNKISNLNINLVSAAVNDNLDAVRDFSPDLLVSTYYRHIVAQSVLQLCNFGGVNYHPSLLPKNRGCFSSSWEILNGDEYFGLTFHSMENLVDTGRSFFQYKGKILPEHTAGDLFNIKHRLGVANIDRVVKYVLNGGKGEKIPEKGGTFHRRELPSQGIIDPQKHGYEYAVRLVRALSFPGKPPAVLRHPYDGLIDINSPEELKRYEAFF